MYEFLVLSKLSHVPMHGYMIANVIGHIMGPFRKVQWGALYPVLTRLEQEGLIRAVACAEDGDGRSRKVYAITEAGRERLHDLVMDTEHHLGDYADLFAQKVTLFSQLTAEERVYLARHYAVYAQQNIDYLQSKRRDVQGKTDMLHENHIRDIVSVMDHRVDYWRGELIWAEQLLSQQTVQEAL